MKERDPSGLIKVAKTTLPRLMAPLGIDFGIQTETENSSGTSHPYLWAHINVDVQTSPVALYVRSRVTDQLIEDAYAELNAGSTIPLIVTPYLRPAAQARLRALGINFADLTGTVSLRAPGIRIEVQGRGTPPNIRQHEKKHQINPFSKKASILLRTLCESFGAPLRVPEIADRTSLSRGWISGVINELTARGYARYEDHGVTLINPAMMLRDWIREYKWTKNVGRQFVVPFAQDEIIGHLASAFKRDHVQWALTLTAGARLRLRQSPNNGVIQAYAHAENSVNVDKALEAVHAEPVPDGGNLLLLFPPYYGTATFIGANKSESAFVVSDVQLLLDLVHFPVRGAELAETLVKSRIRTQFDLTNQDTTKLIEAFA